MPLDRSENGRHIVRRTPPVLQYVQTQFAGAVDVWVKHLADELDPWRFVRVRLFEVHHEAKGAILKRRVRGTDDDGVPGVK